MSFQILDPELQELQKNYGGEPVKIDATKTTAAKAESVETFKMQTGRIAHFVYHHKTDSITVFNVEEAPPEPIPEPVEKLKLFLEGNPDVKELLGL